MNIPDTAQNITIRTTLQPGDIGAVVGLHGTLYAREYGFNEQFEAYVAEPLGRFVREATERERIWIAERDGRILGCIAIVAASPDVAQLRWFLVDTAARGMGLGRALLDAAVAFSRERGYGTIVLWTVSSLTTAAHLYTAAGFENVESHPVALWGVNVNEEKYEMKLV